MPLPTPQLVPVFTDSQLAEARRIAAQPSAPYRHVLRARLTLVLAAEPTLHHREVARRLGISLDNVRKWRRRWTYHAWSLEDAPRSGRPPAFSPSGRDPRQGAGV